MKKVFTFPQWVMSLLKLLSISSAAVLKFHKEFIFIFPLTVMSPVQ